MMKNYQTRDIVRFVNDQMSFVNDRMSFVNDWMSFVNDWMSFVNDWMSFVHSEPLNRSERLSLLQRVLPRRPPPGEPQPPQRAPKELGPPPGRSRFGEVCRGAVQHRMQPRVDQRPPALVPQPQPELVQHQPPVVRPRHQRELGPERE